MTTLLTDLTALLGESHIVTDKAALAPRLTDNRGRWHGDVLAAVLPADTSEVAEVMKIAARHRALVFTQGGNTGNAAGATPVVEPQDVSRSILILTDRMRRIEAIDTVNDTVTVQAGVPVAAIREAAAQKGRLFPLSLASDGTATAGGVLATNAGGVHVVRWGNARAQCLGLEAVLADGRVLNMLRGLRKDNTGYDVKQLFIGSEGTLGVITRAVFKLEPLPAARTVLWLTFGELETAEILFEKLEKAAGGMLSAFEVMHRTPLARVASVYPERTSGVPMSDAWSALVEFSCPTVREVEKIEETIEALSENSLKRASSRMRSQAAAKRSAGNSGPCANRSPRRTRKRAATSSTTSACRGRFWRSSCAKRTRLWLSVFHGWNRVFSGISATAIFTTMWESSQGKTRGFALTLKAKSTLWSTKTSCVFPVRPQPSTASGA